MQDPQRTLELQCERCVERSGQAETPDRAHSPILRSGRSQAQLQDAPDSGCASVPAAADSGDEAACAGMALHAELPRQLQPQRRRLRILCLHGFRQSASGFRGRSAALAKRLAPVAELAFADAPHPLPLCVKEPRGSCAAAASPEPASGGAVAGRAGSQACGDGCACGAQRQGGAGQGSCAGGAARLRRAWLLEPCQVEASQVTCEWCRHACEYQCHTTATGRSFRVLRAQVGHGSQALADGGLPGAAALPVMDKGQHLRQTEGWTASRDYLQFVMERDGPFDGVLGFSQVRPVSSGFGPLLCMPCPL